MTIKVLLTHRELCIIIIIIIRILCGYYVIAYAHHRVAPVLIDRHKLDHAILVAKLTQYGHKVLIELYRLIEQKAKKSLASRKLGNRAISLLLIALVISAIIIIAPRVETC